MVHSIPPLPSALNQWSVRDARVWHGHSRLVSIETPPKEEWLCAVAPASDHCLRLPLFAVLCTFYISSRPLVVPLNHLYFLATAWTTLGALFVGRALSGLAIGITCCVVNVYVSEIATVAWRGALGTLFQASNVAGLALAYLLGIFLHWRAMAFFCITCVAKHCPLNREWYEMTANCRQRGNTFCRGL